MFAIRVKQKFNRIPPNLPDPLRRFLENAEEDEVKKWFTLVSCLLEAIIKHRDEDE